MSFHTRVNAGGWGTDSELTSAQINQLDVDHADTKDFYYASTIAAATYTIDTGSSPDHVLLVTPAAGAALFLPAAVVNRVLRIKYQSGTGTVAIHPNGTDTIEGLNATYNLTQIGSEITLVGITGGWAIIARGHNLASQTFTATTLSGWTAPAGCYFVDLECCGGGGGGGGGAAGTTGVSQRAGGGSGGGGAPHIKQRVAVTPGTAYDITIGGGGSGGASAANGSDGGSTSFKVHLGSILLTAIGGGGGLAGVVVTNAAQYVPGGTTASATSTGVTNNYLTAESLGVAGQGGFGGTGISPSASQAGSLSATGFGGGTAGTTGGDVNTAFGGAGGGGGGGGPYAAGAAGGTGAGTGISPGTGVAGAAGSSPSANSGAGAGGGQGGGCGTVAGGAGGTGGTGGSGKLVISWCE